MILSLGLVVVVLRVALVPVGAAPDKSTCLKSNIDVTNYHQIPRALFGTPKADLLKHIGSKIFSLRGEPEDITFFREYLCIYSSECCSGCCSESKCVEYADSCQSDLAKLGAGKGGPCANLDPPCKPSYTCILQQPQCPRAPCKPVPTCVPPDYHDYD